MLKFMRKNFLLELITPHTAWLFFMFPKVNKGIPDTQEYLNSSLSNQVPLNYFFGKNLENKNKNFTLLENATIEIGLQI